MRNRVISSGFSNLSASACDVGRVVRPRGGIWVRWMLHGKPSDPFEALASRKAEGYGLSSPQAGYFLLQLSVITATAIQRLE